MVRMLQIFRFSWMTVLLISISVVFISEKVTVAQSSSLLLSPTRSPSEAPARSHLDERGLNRHSSGAGYESIYPTIDPRDEVAPMTRAIERVSLFATPIRPPRQFKVEDLVTIIIRQSKKYTADAVTETKKKWNLMGKLSDWFSFHFDDPGNKIGAEAFINGEPGFKFDFDNKYKADAQSEREDKFTTRITARIIDVKPNGNLVLEAMLREQHDEEVSTIMLTGICRSADVTPDNTVLSTQLADINLIEDNRGTVRNAARLGWIPKILNFSGGPF